jgi:hypothetical protein
LHGEISRVDSGVSTLHGEISRLDSEVPTMHGEISPLASEVFALHGEVSCLHSKVSSVLTTKVATLPDRILIGPVPMSTAALNTHLQVSPLATSSAATADSKVKPSATAPAPHPVVWQLETTATEWAGGEISSSRVISIKGSVRSVTA